MKRPYRAKSVEQNGPYSTGTKRGGYIDKSGRFVVEPQFIAARSFSQGMAAVKVGDQETRKWGYINMRDEFVIKPQFVFCDGFRAGIAPVLTEKGKVGYIDNNGQFVVKPQYENCEGGFGSIKAFH